MTIRYAPVRADDAVLRDRMKTIARQRRCFGYRRIHMLLKREGMTVNHKRLFWLYREEKLPVRKRGGRKRALGTRAPMLVPLMQNQRRSLNILSDQFTDCHRFRVLKLTMGMPAAFASATTWVKLSGSGLVETMPAGLGAIAARIAS